MIVATLLLILAVDSHETPETSLLFFLLFERIGQFPEFVQVCTEQHFDHM